MPYPNAGGRAAARPRSTAPAPFWTRIRAIAAYPLKGGALRSLIGLTVASMFTVFPIAGLVLAVILFFATYKYAFEILRQSADGHLQPPEHSFDIGNGIVFRLIALVCIMVFALILVAGLTRSALLTGITAIVLVWMQPGSMIALAMENSLRKALDPLVSLNLARRIGWPYLAAFGLLLVIQVSAATASGWLAAWMPMMFARMAVSAVTIWGLFATFHLLGYLVFQYHEALGYEPSSLAEDDYHRDPDAGLLEQAEALVLAGRNQAALEELRAQVRSRAVSLPVHELYHRLLRQDGNRDALLEHARQYIGRMIDARQERPALALAREMLDIDPDFLPPQDQHASVLAQRAQLGGQHALAQDLLLAMLRRWPRAEHAPQWALDAAMLLAERSGRDDEARALLQQALQSCDNQIMRQKLQATLAALTPQVKTAFATDPSL